MALALRDRIDRTLKQLTCATIAVAAAVVALFFFSLAAFVFMSERYSTIVAALVLGGAYLVLALAALIWLGIARRRERREAANQAAAVGAAGLLQDPIVVSTGLEVLRALGSRKAAPLVAVLLAGGLIAASRFSSKSKPSRSGSNADG
jgi:4-amino-4-deoxy-L-arabinose transferase-like glycosyltransferase